jgi:predicted metal-dependent peptidase
MGSQRAYEVLTAGRLLAKTKAPYFRALLLSFVLREAFPVSARSASPQNGIVLWDPAFIAQLRAGPEIGGLWLHECMHRLNRHAERRGTRDPKFFNMAGDLAINPSVVEMDAELPAVESTPGSSQKTSRLPARTSPQMSITSCSSSKQQQTKQRQQAARRRRRATRAKGTAPEVRRLDGR